VSVGRPLLRVDCPFRRFVGRHLRALVLDREDALHPQLLHNSSRSLLLGRGGGHLALGTAAGDMTAVTLHLGYFASGVMSVVVVAVPAVAHRWFGLNAILAFWLAYVATRPLGASFADWMAVSHARGGLNLGAGSVILALAILIVVFAVYLTVNPAGEDVVRKQPVEPAWYPGAPAASPSPWLPFGASTTVPMVRPTRRGSPCSPSLRRCRRSPCRAC
jgi:Repeat of Unknown Function (DUF347)